ncbi:carboxymuconolactone decarboxylase family protein [Nocardia sp. ET3-3]|uniref:Carboxymuconolactone decarboxylase family protein n=1 Tax=Nocardia terrae TaxID=2675851 RepID=A0A7K1V7W6_9NOCA|nr:carboxymuconolactone decarboxylase family protein [Nocardia terrae]MVU82198.1 carboxymuconolactone decarboxylase family protein [Nocardia terrae]
MSGFPLLEPEDAPAATAALFAEAQQAFGMTANLTKAMANSPSALRGYLDLSDALRHGRIPLPTRERLALLVAQHNSSDYALSAHTYRATKVAGLTPDEASRARRADSTDPEAEACLAFAHALLIHNGTVTDADLLAAHTTGLSPELLLEIIAHVALNVFTTYVTTAGRVAIDWPQTRHTD